MRKFIYVIVAPLVTIILLILKFPNIETKLKTIDANAVIYIQVFLIAATAFTYYVTMYSPYAKYEELAKKRWFLIQVYAERFQQQYREYQLNFNIMVPKTRYFYCIEPKDKNPAAGAAGSSSTGGQNSKQEKKFTFRGKIFKVVWNSGQGVNRKLKITTNQGACGKAFSEGRIFSADYAAQQKPVSNFNEEQERLVSDLKFVISVPLVSYDEKIEYVNNKVQGVLNVESTVPGSESLINDPAKNVAFYNQIFEFQKICAKLLK